MNAHDFLDAEIDKLENTLIGKHLPADEVTLSSNIGRQIARIAMGLLEQEQGYRPAEGEPLIPFNQTQCLQVVHLFLMGITHASMKAWEYKITGEPKSTILQNLAEELFVTAKQITATTIGQELTPDMTFNNQQQTQWIQQTAEGLLSHHWQLYEREHGRISHQANATQSANALATYQAQQQASHVIEQHPATDEIPANKEDERPPQSSHSTVAAAYNQSAPSVPTQPIVNDKQEQLLTKLAAFGLFLTTQNKENQHAWLTQFPAEQQQWILHYMNPQAVMQERHMEAVVEALNTLTQSINTQKQQPAFQQAHSQHQLQSLLQQCGWQTVEGLLQTERPAVKAFLKALATHKPVKTPSPFSSAVQQSMLQYFQTLLVEGR